jgi:hypothetical protein
MTLSTKIKLYANKEIDFLTDVLLQDDGNGPYIKEWNLDIAKPTQAQLRCTMMHKQPLTKTTKKIIATRKALYGSWDIAA